MQIFKIDNKKLNELNEKTFKLEKEIQVIFENNLNKCYIESELFLNQLERYFYV
jgi:hypothetical protein